MKHGNTHYMEVSRDIWDYAISDKAKMLFFWLNELEQRYTGEKIDYFFRTDKQLAEDLGWSVKTLRKAKTELKDNAKDLVKFGYVNWWLDKAHTKKSPKHVTSYTILK